MHYTGPRPNRNSCYLIYFKSGSKFQLGGAKSSLVILSLLISENHMVLSSWNWLRPYNISSNSTPSENQTFCDWRRKFSYWNVYLIEQILDYKVTRQSAEFWPRPFQAISKPLAHKKCELISTSPRFHSLFLCPLRFLGLIALCARRVLIGCKGGDKTRLAILIFCTHRTDQTQVCNARASQVCNARTSQVWLDSKPPL